MFRYLMLLFISTLMLFSCSETKEQDKVEAVIELSEEDVQKQALKLLNERLPHVQAQIRTVKKLQADSLCCDSASIASRIESVEMELIDITNTLIASRPDDHRRIGLIYQLFREYWENDPVRAANEFIGHLEYIRNEILQWGFESEILLLEEIQECL